MNRINNIDKLARVISYEHFDIGMGTKIYPSDIDGVIDIKGKLFIFLEFKEENKDLQLGQRILFENLSKALTVPCYTILAYHSPSDEVISAKDCKVHAVHTNNKWKMAPTLNDITVPQLIQRILEKHGL